jgi:hypothetical protein
VLRHYNSYLYASLAEVETQSELLSGEHVGVLRLLEGAFELVQLVGGECGAAAARFVLLLLVLLQHLPIFILLLRILAPIIAAVHEIVWAGRPLLLLLVMIEDAVVIFTYTHPCSAVTIEFSHLV